MTFLGSFQKKETLFFLILIISIAAFTADIVDLRDELHILSCPAGSLDSNVTTGIISKTSFETEPLFLSISLPRDRSVTISFLHLLPCDFRAPPARS